MSSTGHQFTDLSSQARRFCRAARWFALSLCLVWCYPLAATTPGGTGNGSVTLAWDPSPSTVAGYNLYYGTTSGERAVSIQLEGNQTNAVVPGLARGTRYYFVVTAYNANGQESLPSNEVNYLVPAVNSNQPAPPLPWQPWTPPTAESRNLASCDLPGITNRNTPVAAATNRVGWIGGVPPCAFLNVSNRQTQLTIWGTVGADYLVQSAPDPGAARWTTLTNVVLTEPAPVVAGAAPGHAVDLLDRTFVPALQAWPVPSPSQGTSCFFRVVMPYDYAVLADRILRGKGCSTRMVVVRLAGLVAPSVCYVAQDRAYVYYHEGTQLMSLVHSGQAIRDIATSVAGWLGENWTSASEFTFADGLKQTIATVVKTDSPASDPAPGTRPARSGIVIDF